MKVLHITLKMHNDTGAETPNSGVFVIALCVIAIVCMYSCLTTVRALSRHVFLLRVEQRVVVAIVIGIVIVIAVVAVKHGLKGIFSIYTGGIRGHARLGVSGSGRGSSNASAPLATSHPNRQGSELSRRHGVIII